MTISCLKISLRIIITTYIYIERETPSHPFNKIRKILPCNLRFISLYYRIYIYIGVRTVSRREKLERESLNNSITCIQHMTSLRSLYLRVVGLGEGVPFVLFPFCVVSSSRSSFCFTFISPENSDFVFILSSETVDLLLDQILFICFELLDLSSI